MFLFTSHVKHKCERESSPEMSENDWDGILEGQAKTTSLRSWQEFCLKYILQHYLTPKLKFIQQGFQGQGRF